MDAPPPHRPPVSASAYRAMTTPATLANGKVLSYGYGLGVDSFGGHRRFFHGGGLPGFDGWVAFFPDDDVTVVALCNTDGDVAHGGRRRDGGPRPRRAGREDESARALRAQSRTRSTNARSSSSSMSDTAA